VGHEHKEKETRLLHIQLLRQLRERTAAGQWAKAQSQQRPVVFLRTDHQNQRQFLNLFLDEEVCLELRNQNPPPSNILTGYTVELVWKSTSYKRMDHGLKQFWTNSNSISSYLYFRILGFDNDPPVIDIDLPKTYSAPNLPELNYYQIEATQKALKSPLCLI